jgi:hypothetical protein
MGARRFSDGGQLVFARFHVPRMETEPDRNTGLEVAFSGLSQFNTKAKVDGWLSSVLNYLYTFTQAEGTG